MMTRLAYTRSSLAALIITTLVTATPNTFAADDFWVNSGSEFYDLGANWQDGSPAIAGDIANFDLFDTYTVRWGGATGDTASDGVNVINGDVTFTSTDGPMTHTHSVFGNVLLDLFGTLTLDAMSLDATVGSLIVGDQDSATLNVINGGVMTSDSAAIGLDTNLLDAFSEVTVSTGGQLNVTGHLGIGVTGNGFGTAQVTVNTGGALNSGSIDVAANAGLTITDLNGNGTTASFALLSANDAAFVRIVDGAVVTAGGPDSAVNINGGSFDLSNGAQLLNLQSLSGQGGLLGPAMPSGAVITVDGANTLLDITAQSVNSFTGLGLGFGGAAAMSITNGAAVNIGDTGVPGIPSGFAVGQDLPVALGGPTGDTSSLLVDGMDSQLIVTGFEIAASVGSSTAAVHLLDTLFSGVFSPDPLDNPGGTGTLQVSNGAVVALQETPGGTSRFVVGDTVGATGTVDVFGTGAMLDAGQSLELGLLGGQASVNVFAAGQLTAENVQIGENGVLDVSGFGTNMTFGGGGAPFGHFINVNGGSMTVSGGATLDGQGPDALLQVIGDSDLTIASGAQATNVQFIFAFGGPGSTPDVLIDGATTVVDLNQKSANNGTGLFVGFGGDAAATISGGATVNIGAPGTPSTPDVASGFTVGSNVPLAVGGPSTGASVLTVDGPGSTLYVNDDDSRGSVGTATPFVDFFEKVLGFINVDNPGGDGTLIVSNGGSVILDETLGGTSSLLVADTLNAVGRVQVWGGGATLDAGQLFALGVDLVEADGGFGTLDIFDGGNVLADRLVVGSNASANLWGGTLTVGELATNALNFDFQSGVLNLTASDLTVGAGGVLGDHVVINAPRTINVTQDVIVDPTAVLELVADKLSTPNLINNGETFVNGTKVGEGIEVLQNNGRVTGGGQVDSVLHNTASGEVRATAAETLRFTKAGNTNDGEINVFNGSVEFAQDLSNSAGAFIGGRGLIEAAGGLNNQGVMAFSGQTDILGDVDNNGSGQVIISGGSILTFFDDVVHNGLEIRASAGSQIVFFGALSGAGPFTGGGDFFLEGDLRPGNSPGFQSFDGNVTFGAANDSVMEIGGLTRAAAGPGLDEYDAIDVTGILTYGGTLAVELVDLGGGLFAPGEGDVFNLFDAGSIAGAFSSLFLPALGAGLVWNSAALNTLGELSVAAVPLPTAVWLMLSALMGLGFIGRRSRAAP